MLNGKEFLESIKGLPINEARILIDVHNSQLIDARVLKIEKRLDTIEKQLKVKKTK